MYNIGLDRVDITCLPLFNLITLLTSTTNGMWYDIESKLSCLHRRHSHRQNRNMNDSDYLVDIVDIAMLYDIDQHDVDITLFKSFTSLGNLAKYLFIFIFHFNLYIFFNL